MSFEMSKLGGLIQNLHNARKSVDRKDSFHAEQLLLHAAEELADYVLDHADEYAERERLERAYAQAKRKSDPCLVESQNAHDVIHAQMALLDFVLRHAETETK